MEEEDESESESEDDKNVKKSRQPQSVVRIKQVTISNNEFNKFYF